MAYDPYRPRIFGIGLNKTATNSLHQALTILGFKSLHWGGHAVSRMVTESINAGESLLERLDQQYDAFFDIDSITAGFDLADEQYPGSKFILTTRNIDDWVNSRRRHVQKNQVMKSYGRYFGDFLEIDTDAWRNEWHSHLRRVRGHFADRRNDLLEIDITAGEGWAPLCSFLGVSQPDMEFPWLNKYKTFGMRSKAKALIRRRSIAKTAFQ